MDIDLDALSFYQVYCARSTLLFFNKKYMGKIVGIIIIAITIIGYIALRKDATKDTADTNTSSQTMSTATGTVKEFSTTAYYDEIGVWYSLKEIRVKQGDLVRIKATNIKGVHDFTLDEFDIKKELPLNTEVVIEFTADKAGEFTYYCSKPGHRAKGQFGKLIVE
ncbi:MAG TPA: cupredoxin domain-containing protein [Patescibacteria group bacterium]|nr:cupredoxin domain-containing protein [Patescibacteria group bacterium]